MSGGTLTSELEDSRVTRITGSNEAYAVDVELINGKRRLLTDSIVTVEQIFGQDNYADNWFWIDQAGILNSTIRIQIPAYVDPTGVERAVPAVDKTITLTAAEAGKEIVLRDFIISQLNADSNFGPHWKATAVKDNAIVHISSKYVGEYGERSSFTLTATDANIITVAFADIKRRGKANSGQRDPKDRRLVTVGISGEVVSIPGAVGDLYIGHATNAGSDSMLVNGSVTPVVFSIGPDTISDIFIKELRFFGNGNGIKFGQFLSRNIILTNGILVQIKSDDKLISFDAIKMTDDFKHEFSFGPGAGFQLHIQSGRDDFLSSFAFDAAFPLRKSGTFLTDDYIKIFIRDDLTSNILALQFLAFGFKREV